MYWWCKFAGGRSARVMQQARVRPCIPPLSQHQWGLRVPPGKSAPQSGTWRWGTVQDAVLPRLRFTWKGVHKRLWVWISVSVSGCGFGPLILIKGFKTSSILTTFNWLVNIFKLVFSGPFSWSFPLFLVLCQAEWFLQVFPQSGTSVFVFFLLDWLYPSPLVQLVPGLVCFLEADKPA